MTAICVEDESLILQLTVSLCQELPALDELPCRLLEDLPCRWLVAMPGKVGGM